MAPSPKGGQPRILIANMGQDGHDRGAILSALVAGTLALYAAVRQLLQEVGPAGGSWLRVSASFERDESS